MIERVASSKMILSPPKFARQFRGLSADEQREFVASIWRRRGYETVVENQVVLAKQEGETIRIRVVGGWPVRAKDSDVWVSRRDTVWSRSKARDVDAEYVSPAELLSILLYAIPRPRAERITRRHFGVSLEELEDRRDRRMVTLAAVGALTILVVVLSLGPPALGPEPANPGPQEPISPHLNANLSNEGRTYPPGLSPKGVTDSERLIRVHEAQVAARPKIILFRYRGPPADKIKHQVARHESRLKMYDPETYHYTVTETTVDSEGLRRNSSQTIFRNDSVPGIHNILRIDNGAYSFTHPVPQGGWPDQPPEMMRKSVISLYSIALSAEDTSTEDLELLGGRLYRVTATGEPSQLGAQVTSFKAVAYLTIEGRIVHLRVSYEHIATERPVVVTVRYDRIGSVKRSEFSPPGWV